MMSAPDPMPIVAEQTLWHRIKHKLRQRMFFGDEYDSMRGELDALLARVQAIEASLEPEIEKPRRGSEWDVLG